MEGTPITEEYVNTLLTVTGLSLLAGIIIPFAAAMVFGTNVDISERAVGVLLFVIVGLLYYLAVRVWRKYKRQKEKSE